MSVSKFTASLHNIPIYTYPSDNSQVVESLRSTVAKDYITDIKKSYIKSLVNNASTNVHASCNFKQKFDKDIREIMNNIPSAVLDSHLRHMEEQTKN
jgi:hypothetical protein